MKTSYGLPGIRASLDLMPFTEPDPPGLLLTRVEVAASDRGRGLGTELLRSALREADREGVWLYLAVEPDGSPGAPGYEELRKWYLRHGFVGWGQQDATVLVRAPH